MKRPCKLTLITGRFFYCQNSSSYVQVERCNMIYNNEFAEIYGIAPRTIMRDSNLTIEAKVIFCYFRMLAGASGKAWPKRETILNDLAVGKNRYYKHANTLIKQGLITVEQENGKNIYHVKDRDNIEKTGYGKVSMCIMRDCRLTIEAKAIYCYFQSLAGTSGRAWPKRETILHELCISKDRFYKHLRFLIDAGYIKIEFKNGRNVYWIACRENDVAYESRTANLSKTPADQNSKLVLPKADDDMCNAKERKKEHTSRYYSKREEKRFSASDVDVSVPVLEAIIDLQQKYPKCYNELALIRKIIIDTSMAKYVTVSGIVRSQTVVNDLLKELKEEHITAVLKTLIDSRNKINNKRAWIQACLFNSIFNLEERQIFRDTQAVEKYNAAYVTNGSKSEQKDEKGGTQQDEYIEKRNEEIDRLNAKLSRAILLGNDYVKEQCLKDIQKIDSEISDHMQAQSA